MYVYINIFKGLYSSCSYQYIGHMKKTIPYREVFVWEIFEDPPPFLWSKFSDPSLQKNKICLK
jgi:hypothetical protein